MKWNMVMGTIPALATAISLVALVAPATAHHPGADLDRLMGSKEKFFQAKDRPAPEFGLRDPTGRDVALSDFRGDVVVLNFVYARCPDVCPLHAEKLAEVQAMVNRTPMKQRVRFLTITTDPRNDSPEVMREYGPLHGLDPANWAFLTTRPGQPEDWTRGLAKAYGHKFIKSDGGYQVHGLVTHIIDPAGRWAANFHGLRFDSVNMVLYINGLINDKAKAARRPAARRIWDEIKRMF